MAVLCFTSSPRFVVRAHLFSWLVDWQTVCEPDYVQCPNGGLTFRDREHKCVFTPCEFIPNPPLPSPPPDPKTLSVHTWWGRYEFMVPSLSVDAMQRGKAVETAWVDAIVAKRQQLIRANFSATFDVYMVAMPPGESVASAYAAHAQDLHMDTLVASQVELFVEHEIAAESSSSSSSSSSDGHGPSAGMSATARDLAVSTSPAPWTRWEFFGQFDGRSSISPTVVTVQTALRLLKNKTTAGQATHSSSSSNASRFVTLVIEAESESDIMSGLIDHCDVAVASPNTNDTQSSKSILVFTTDFRTEVGAAKVRDEVVKKPWNMTRVQCEYPAMAKNHTNSTASITLLPSNNVSELMDAGHEASEDSMGDSNCSCWMRSLVGESNHTTQWMRCH